MDSVLRLRINSVILVGVLAVCNQAAFGAEPGHHPNDAQNAKVRVGTAVIDYSTPGAGPVGCVVYIYGHGLLGTTGVSFNGKTAINFSTESDKEVRAAVPPDAESGPIRVLKLNGSVKCPDPFTVQPDVQYLSICGCAGDKESWTIPDPPPNAALSGVYLNSPVSSKFTYDPQTHNVDWWVADGATSGPLLFEWTTTTFPTRRFKVTGWNPFVVMMHPVIESLSPSSEQAGHQIKINGKYLTEAALVLFPEGIPASFHVDSDTQITATVPPDCNSGPIRVTTCGGEARSAASFVVPNCGKETFPRPPHTPIDAVNGWSMAADVTDRDGLTLSNVTLGGRQMAEQISVPYVMVHTTSLADTRIELTPDVPPGAGPGTPHCRLVDFQISEPASTLVVQAVYSIDHIPDTAQSCLEVIQRYEFDEVDPDAFGKCFPPPNAPWPISIFTRQQPPCACWRPTITYLFSSPADPNEKLVSFSAPQRFWFKGDSRVPQASSLIRDCDEAFPFCWRALNYPVPHMTILDRWENPVQNEELFYAIVGGQDNHQWDNYHQTSARRVVPPSVLPPGPGCPECVHVHWRWGANAPNKEYYGSGKALIPAGSNQDVRVGVAAWHPGEEHPDDYTTLFTGESLPLGDLVFWYEGRGYMPTDTFMSHGGFFFPSVPAPPPIGPKWQVTQTHTPEPGTVGQNVTFTITVTNVGGIVGHSVAFSDLVPPGLQYVTAQSPRGNVVPIPGVGFYVNLGDLDPQETVQITLVAKPTLLGIPRVANLATASTIYDDFDPSYTGDKSVEWVTVPQ